jgi:hypothetical protein
MISQLNLNFQHRVSPKTLESTMKFKSRWLNRIHSSENPWCPNQRSSCLVPRGLHLLRTIKLHQLLSIAKFKAHQLRMFWSVPNLLRVAWSLNQTIYRRWAINQNLRMRMRRCKSRNEISDRLSFLIVYLNIHVFLEHYIIFLLMSFPIYIWSVIFILQWERI